MAYSVNNFLLVSSNIISLDTSILLWSLVTCVFSDNTSWNSLSKCLGSWWNICEDNYVNRKLNWGLVKCLSFYPAEISKYLSNTENVFLFWIKFLSSAKLANSVKVRVLPVLENFIKNSSNLRSSLSLSIVVTYIKIFF